MNESFRLGRIAGIQVGAHWSALAVLALVTVGLATGWLPLAAPGRSPVEYAVTAVVAGVLFLLSLLAHEVSHAVLARRNGLPVERITLWLFGGVALLRGEPATPGADLRIAGVGPLVSVGLGAGFVGLGGLASAGQAGPLIVAALSWLGVINLVLAVFNLVPAAPLDGGRVLRAALWRWTGDRQRAAVTAARAGRLFGIVLLGLGLAQVLVGGSLSGLWLALIGWFLVAAARAEEEYATTQRALAGIRVGDIMTPDPVTVPPELTVGEFIDRHLLNQRFSTFPLLDDRRQLAGLVTLNRIRQVPAGSRADTSLRQVACPPDQVAVARPDEDLLQLLPRMSGCADGRAIVLDEAGRVIGIVSPTDIARPVQNADLLQPRTAASPS
ncbi:MAG TPA: site-2 protease family protein [Pseudonocardiaceae bacterium]|jgi:Zn-dependent protease/predicted transcriptional regulator|nr:site-2 protease family protein [Pseudonocardiaceae bacterium]